MPHGIWNIWTDYDQDNKESFVAIARDDGRQFGLGKPRYKEEGSITTVLAFVEKVIEPRFDIDVVWVFDPNLFSTVEEWGFECSYREVERA
jgi:hypothetical protein